MQSSAELKRQAKESLKGRWGQAVLLNLIPTLIGIAAILLIMIPIILFATTIYDGSASVSDATTSGGGGGIISSIISALFMSGISWTYLDILRGQKDQIEPFKDAFRGFKGLFIGGVIGLAVLISIFTTLWGLLLVIPGIIKSYSYSQSYFIYYDIVQETGQTPKVLDTITASRKLMDGYKGQLFWLDLSFIGWHILALATAGIGYLWLSPYISATKAAFYEQLPKDI
ncbi:integral membrane protein [Enterococcus faecium EnGen0192]|uniref:Integral membrane protein n=1 Tax=Enterococcus faecium EnGen0192 TaxID=1157487 RepID=A0A829FCL8_ENTFC|nr:DUF975 family protein [Enterococcus faecium]EGP5615542.1 DUF975 family protein [Enterococcus faecium]ELA75621.1 integral membrane protein [Enterococcus faecium EnGen0011]EME8213958.1 DUF975 family protein [Enterococcus faecium]EOM28115.1 integral membrane protein [Enterococcus faecium EnGen0192]MCL4619713.1 DUF975 family protein [Enterococcus faecium]